jgi:predicted nuclease of restriction endonuclease-like (RecB) superfamily
MFELIDVEFYENIKKIINESRKHVVTYVNTTMLFTYWNIGKMIFEEQGGSNKAKYGDKLIAELSKQMTLDFGKGFDERNLRYMRQFYLSFPIWNTVRSELTWTHYRTLMRVEEKHIRSFYMDEAIKGNWSVRQLERQIATCSYSRVIANNSDVKKINNINETAALAKYEPNTVIKDPYMLEFLGLDNNVNYLEKELEDALINHLQRFLLELGRGFCFVAKQKRISFDNEHYFIDLVFYNSILKCYVVIDLKTDKLSHEALGQIDLYRNYYDQEVKQSNDNPTIGLLLVTEQDTLVAKYSSIYKDQNIFVSKYMTYMPTEEELVRVINEEKRLIEDYKISNKL